MKPTLWIWNKYQEVWTNGKHIITAGVIEHYPWETIRTILFKEGVLLPEQRFDYPKRIEPEWKPFTIKQLMAILESK